MITEFQQLPFIQSATKARPFSTSYPRPSPCARSGGM